MVKFGGHVEAVRDGDLVDANLYLVPYNKMKLLIPEPGQEKVLDMETSHALLNGAVFVYDGTEQKQAEDTPSEEEVFIGVWKKGLKEADEDFTKARAEIWRIVFEGIAANDDTADPMVRGAHPGNAIKLYADLMNRDGNTEAHELLSRMNQIHHAASVNSEALRKLVKKFDKHRNEKQLSSTLLPLLYTSSLYSGQTMILESIGLLRELISGEYEELANGNNDDDKDLAFADRPFKSIVRRDSEARHQEALDLRMMEFNWLKSLTKSIPNDLIGKLVSHRGFHSTKDHTDKRPVENSLSAYEMAWTCGVELCECDISLTKDEKLVLAHDSDFFRLALDSNSESSKKKVGDLTFREIMSMPLRNGVRPPLLIDVLRSANAISEKSKLVIEIKPGNQAAAFALSRMLIRHPDLRSSVAMIMSFDAQTMHQLRAELERAIMPPPDYSDGNTGMPLQSHRRVTSYDHFGTMSSAWLGGMGMSTANLGASTYNFGASTANFGKGSTKNFGMSTARLPTIPAAKRDSLDLNDIGLSISQNNLAEDNQESIPTSTSFDSYHRKPSNPNMPKLMLLTVADPPNIPCELQVKHNELHRVDDWLVQNDGCLDGVYLQYEKEMLTAEGAAHLRELSQRFMVGIWNYADKDPDDFEYFEVRLYHCEDAFVRLRSNHFHGAHGPFFSCTCLLSFVSCC